MEGKKGSIAANIIAIVLLLAFLAGGFILGKHYSKVEEKSQSNEVETSNKGNTNNEKSANNDLDINSKLVQFLYNEVTYNQDEPSMYFGWEFNNFRNNNQDVTADFYSDKADEKYKMILVGRNVSESNSKFSFNIPEKPNIGYIKENETKYFTKNYVETVYKILFGEDAKLDTSVPMYMDLYGGEVYSYDVNTNNYYKYFADVGGTSGPGGYTAKLVKAEQNNDIIELYQDVELKDVDNSTVKEKFQYIYKFELEKDGMYKFVSRIKK